MATCDYVPTPRERAIEMLSFAGLKEGEVLYDLGCGTGDILIAGAEVFKAKCYGIEKDRRLVKWAEEDIRKRGLESRIKIFKGNIFSREFWLHKGGDENKAVAKADVVALYLTLWVQEELKPLLEKELKQGARVVSREFKVMGWEPVKAENNLYHFVKGRSF